MMNRSYLQYSVIWNKRAEECRQILRIVNEECGCWEGWEKKSERSFYKHKQNQESNGQASLSF